MNHNSDVVQPLIACVASFIVPIVNELFFPLNDASQDEDKVFRPRFSTWIRQICFSFILIITIISTDDFFTWSWKWLTAFSLIFSLLFDGINNLPCSRRKTLWLVCYALIFPSFLSPASNNPSVLSISTFLLYAIGLFHSTVELLWPRLFRQNRLMAAEQRASLPSYLSFSYLNKVLIDPMQLKSTMEMSDVPIIADFETTSFQWNKIKTSHRSDSIFRKIFKLVYKEWLEQAVFQFIVCMAGIASPIAMLVILTYVKDAGSLEGLPEIFRIDIRIAASLLFIGPATAAIANGQNYTRSKHISIKVRSGLVSMIYNKAMTVDLSAYKEGVGKINNLISVDVAAIQEFSCYSHFLWSTLLDITKAMVLLYLVLGSSALYGLIVMIATLIFGFGISKLLERYQNEVMKHKDNRMSVMNEVLNSIRVIKLFAWEVKFIKKVFEARKIEMASLKKYAFTRIGSMFIWKLHLLS